MRLITPAYPTYDQALRRVTTLKKDLGIWPGIVTGPDGTGPYRLTYDPHFESDTP